MAEHVVEGLQTEKRVQQTTVAHEDLRRLRDSRSSRQVSDAVSLPASLEQRRIPLCLGYDHEPGCLRTQIRAGICQSAAVCIFAPSELA
ncbi:MAG: hypothetical protein WBP48_13715 [Microbacterium sp.]